jgi:hypothetical protein
MITPAPAVSATDHLRSRQRNRYGVTTFPPIRSALDGPRHRPPCAGLDQR